MQTQIHPNNKLASLGTIGLLFLAGIAGMVFLLPASPVHAAGPTLALSTITSTSGVASEVTATSATVGSSVSIAGAGFASGVPIAITSLIGTTTISWLSGSTCGGTFTGSYGGLGTQNGLATGGCLTTTANGNFKTTVTVPSLPGGPETISVTDGTNTGTIAITITPSVTFTIAGGNNFGFPEEGISATVTAAGFGSGESLTLSSTAFTTASFTSTTCTTGTAPGGAGPSGDGSCTFMTAASLYVADTTGGSKTITATGATSGLTASTTYTVNPWVAFYNSATDVTTFSFVGNAPTSLLVEAHGLQSGTIAASSITVGAIATNHGSIAVGATGNFYGVVVSPTTNVPFGIASVVIQGTTFGYPQGNVAVNVPGNAAGAWGWPLISSIAGSGTSTGVVSLNAASYKPGTGFKVSTTSPVPAQNAIAFFGYGFVPGAGAGGAVTIATPANVIFSTPPALKAGNIGGGGANTPDVNGAFFALGAVGETPWSSVATPTVAASYTPTVTQAATFPANILSPSFGIIAWADTNHLTTSKADYTTNEQISFHGFGPTDSVTMTIGGSSMVSGGVGIVGANQSGHMWTAIGKVPDIAGGKQNLVLTGSVSGVAVTVVGAVTFVIRIDNTGGTALNVVSGPAAQTTIVRTGTNFGVHGLQANTAYSIVWNPANGPVTVGTFTSTAAGGIPVPGVQVTIPADISGIHILDIQASSSLGTSQLFGNTKVGDFSDSDTGLAATYATQYGDMLFNLGASLIVTPTVANVGNNVVISGNGLSSSTTYDLGISQAGGGLAVLSSSNPPNSCALANIANPATAPNTILGAFTSTAGGAVPAAVSLAITDMPTYAGNEQGTLYCVYAQTGTNFGTTTAVGIGQFELQASAGLNMTSVPTGHNFVVSAHALAANTAYNVLFNYQVSTFGVISGTVVGAILSNGVGAGSATVTAPNVAPGSYLIELQKVGSTGAAIAVPPTVTIGSISTGCALQGTGCTSVSGTTTTTLNGNKAIQSTWTNNSNAPVTEIVYAVVHNAAGQTVAYDTATVTLAANGGSATAYNVLFGLPSGTYSVSLFSTSTGGIATSTTSTVSVTI